MVESDTQDRWLWQVDKEQLASLFESGAPFVEAVSERPSPEGAPFAAQPEIETSPAVEIQEGPAPEQPIPQLPPDPEPVEIQEEPTPEQPIPQASPEPVEAPILPAEPEAEPLELLRQIAAEHFESGRFEEARAIYCELIVRLPDSAQAHFNQALCLLRLGQAEDAQALLNTALYLAPYSPEIRGALTWQYLSLHEYGKAAELLETASPVEPDATDLAERLTIFLEQEDFASALPIARQLSALTPASWQAWYNLGLAAHEAGTPDEAIRAYRQAIEIDSACENALVNLAALLQDRDQIDAARTCLETALRGNPRHREALWNLSVIEEREGNPANAARLLGELAGVSPSDPEIPFQLGHIRLRTGDWAASAEAFEQCVAMRGDWIEAQVGLALAHWKANGVTAAREYLDSALALNPVFIPALQSRFALAIEERNAAAAAEFEAQLADLGQTRPEFCHNLGLLQERTGNYDAAINSLRRAVGKRPSFGDALLNLGTTLMHSGRAEEAKDAWKAALEAQPELGVEYASI